MADVGRTLGGRYRLLELLGEGGMATIYRAHDLQLDRDVAVKVLRPEYGKDPSFIARFRQEAQAAASLSHPSVVGVYDYGTDEAGPFIVMELVDGRDLAEILRERGALPLNAAVRIAGQVAEALGAAHDRGIIHRDVKPGNILVRRDGRAQIGDFGIVRAFSESELTVPGTTLGSVHYFSPEQARGEQVTERSDLYSLGLVLYEMLTGTRAFEGDSSAALAMARLTTDPPPPSQVRHEVPPALDTIVRKALARDPAQRFPSARAFAEVLRSYLESRRPAAAGAAGAGSALGSASPSAPAVAAADALEATQAERRLAAAPAGTGGQRPPPGRAVGTRRDLVEDEEEGGQPGGGNLWTWAAAVLGLLILLGAGALAFVALSGSRPSSSPPPTPAVQAVVPNLVGLSYQDAVAAARAASLAVSISGTAPSTDQPQNTVVSQDPPAFRTVAQGTTVSVVISSGQPLVTVPNIVGLTERDAITAILGAKLVAGDATETFDPTAPQGTVISQTVPAGTDVPEGTPIGYVLSLGPTPSPTPSPTPVPTPTPTPVPTPTPTPVPTPTPTPVPTGTP